MSESIIWTINHWLKDTMKAMWRHTLYVHQIYFIYIIYLYINASYKRLRVETLTYKYFFFFCFFFLSFNLKSKKTTDSIWILVASGARKKKVIKMIQSCEKRIIPKRKSAAMNCFSSLSRIQKEKNNNNKKAMRCTLWILLYYFYFFFLYRKAIRHIFIIIQNCYCQIVLFLSFIPFFTIARSSAHKCTHFWKKRWIRKKKVRCIDT